MNGPSSAPPIDDVPIDASVSRNEWLAVVGLTLIAAAVRCAFPSAMAVEHFDEGVYASNLWFPVRGFQYPDRHLYAPSFIPAMIEWCLILFGPTNWAPMLPSLVFGILTVPLIWWVGRSWFGSSAGLGAAVLAGLSDYHILFSRSALTDVTLGFWLLLAVYFFEDAFRSLKPSRAVIAGIATGIAWWSKYNGWMALAISLSGLIAWSLFARDDKRILRHRLALWALAAVTALLVWSPFWLGLPNGYAEVAKNHSQYVVGLAGWCAGVVRQMECQRYCVRVATGVSAIVLLLMVAGIMPRRPRNGIAKQSLTPPAPTPAATNLRLARCEWTLAAWFIGLSLTTPLYRPYPRLVLPWTLAAWLVFAWLLFGAMRFENLRIPRIIAAVLWLVAAVASLGMQLLDVPSPDRGFWVAGWESRAALSDLAPKIQDSLRQEVARRGTRAVDGKPAIVFVYVFAEPGLFYHLPADDLAVGPIGDLRFADPAAPAANVPTFLISGPHASRMPSFQVQFEKQADRLELVQRWPYSASDFVLLDQVPPSQLAAERSKCEVQLFRLK